MQILDFQVNNSSVAFAGKLRAIFFHRLIEAVLKNDGKIVNRYGDKTPTKVSLVFSTYPEGNFTISGTGSGYVELFDEEDRDVFDPSLHRSIIQVD